MKLNPLEWNQVDETTFKAQGVLLLRSSSPFALSIQTQGVEASVGADTFHAIPLTEASEVTLLGGTAKVYRKVPPSRVVIGNADETFTNIDRLPQESGTVAEVTKALRLMKLEERAMIRRIREERALSEAVIEARKPKADLDSEAEAQAEREAKPEGDAE